MDANAYTPGRQLWLQLLADNPQGMVDPEEGAVSRACHRLGWTRRGTGKKDPVLHFLTDAGREILAQWIARPPVRTYLRRCLNPAEVLAVIEANGWDLHCDPGPVWSVVLRQASGDRLLAYGTSIAKAVDVAVTAAEAQGILELPPAPPAPVTVDVHEVAARREPVRVSGFACGGFTAVPALRQGEVFVPLRYGAPQAILVNRPLPRYSTCPDCSGIGQRNSILCRRCDGSGHALASPAE